MIGIDLVAIPEFQRQLDEEGFGFLEKAFSLSELKNRQAEHLAGLWAAKEAVMKAVETMPPKMVDIHITYAADGKPVATAGNESFAISIAHHGEYAVAVALKVVA